MKILNEYEREAFNGSYIRSEASGSYLTMLQSVTYLYATPKQFEIFYVRKV